MSNDKDIAGWLDELVKKNMDEVYSAETSTSTLEQARRLLSGWAEQTETFQPEMRPKRPEKIAKYRRLDTPMLVAKKIESTRPSNDPTLIMEARRAHLKDMKAKRLEKMASKAAEIPRSTGFELKVPLPDVEGLISAKKAELDAKLQKQKNQFDERSRQSVKVRAIEQSAAETIAKEISEQKKREDLEIRKKSEQREKEIASSLVLYHQTLKAKVQKHYFDIWSDKCSFHSRLYQRAAKFNDFHMLSAFLSEWKRRYTEILNHRENEELKKNLRKEKRLEEISDKINRHRYLRKALIKWRAMFRVSVEQKIVINSAQQRRNELLEKINSKTARPVDVQEKTEQPSPSKKLKKPKVIKVDPKIEAMTKRDEDIRNKKLQKALKEAKAAQEMENQRLMEQMEAERKKKIEHMKFLENEKKKREEQKLRQQEYEQKIKRSRYLEEATNRFLRNKLLSSHFSSWARISAIRFEQSENAEDHYRLSLLKRSFRSLKKNLDDVIETKMEIANNHHECYVRRVIIDHFMSAVAYTRDLEDKCRKMSNSIRMKRALNLFNEMKKKRRKEKYGTALKHSSKQLLMRAFKAWPIGCAIAKEERDRIQAREQLMTKAMQLLEDLSDSSSF